MAQRLESMASELHTPTWVWWSMEAAGPIAVVVADRDDTARSTAVSILKHFGLTVFIAEDRDRILEALQNHAEISVVFAEAELAPSLTAVKQLRPKVRIIATSDWGCTMERASADGYVQKPYTAGRLMTAVEAVSRSRPAQPSRTRSEEAGDRAQGAGSTMPERLSDREAVLMLDRQPSVRRFVEKVLDYAGYTPLVADTEESAIRLAESSAGRITLVLAESIIGLGPVLERLRPGARISLAVDYNPVVAGYAARVLESRSSDDEKTALYSALVDELIACSATGERVRRSCQSKTA